VYQVSKAAAENYDETGDPKKAVAAGAKQALKIGVSEVTSQTVGTTIDTSWSAIKSAGGITTNEFQDRVLTSAVKNTIEEGLRHD
jgi:galactokinase/mevalonate kinase-like predicted kinase